MLFFEIVVLFIYNKLLSKFKYFKIGIPLIFMPIFVIEYSAVYLVYFFLVGLILSIIDVSTCDRKKQLKLFDIINMMGFSIIIYLLCNKGVDMSEITAITFLFTLYLSLLFIFLFGNIKRSKHMTVGLKEQISLFNEKYYVYYGYFIT